MRLCLSQFNIPFVVKHSMQESPAGKFPSNNDNDKLMQRECHSTRSSCNAFQSKFIAKAKSDDHGQITITLIIPPVQRTIM